MREDADKSPVSFPVNVRRLPKNGMPVVVEASEKQRAALAREHEILEVRAFRADLLVTAWKRNGIQVEGRVEADIVQECIVTLDPLESRIREPVSAVFLPEDSKLGREGFEAGGEIILEVDGPDGPEIFSGETIDVGALAEEFFALAIDPYPRKADSDAEAGLPVSHEPREETEFQKKLKSLLPKS